MKLKVQTNHEKKILELIELSETKRELRGVIDDVSYANRELLAMFSYALYDIHAMYLNGGTYMDLVDTLNPPCAQKTSR